MRLNLNRNQVICREHCHCQYENCKHYSWHEEKKSCKSRRCQKLRQMVKCAKNPLEKIKD